MYWTLYGGGHEKYCDGLNLLRRYQTAKQAAPEDERFICATQLLRWSTKKGVEELATNELLLLIGRYEG